jgi:RimJ/RimL family protein N-acetyltransferase
MFLRPGYRGQGLMKVLLNAVCQSATTEHVRELRLYVHGNNQRAIKALIKVKDFKIRTI